MASESDQFRPPLSPVPAPGTESRSAQSASDQPRLSSTGSAPRDTELFGQEISLARSRRIGFWFWLLLTLLFLAWGWRDQLTGLLIYGCSATALLTLVYWYRPAPKLLRIREEGLEFLPAGRLVPYEQILEVFQHDSLYLLTQRGFEKLPRTLPEAEKLVRFLHSQPLGRRQIPPVPASFQPYLRQQLVLYPLESVHVFTARTQTYSRRIRWLVRFGLGLVLVGAAWCLPAILPMRMAGKNEMLSVGIVFVLVGTLLGLSGWFNAGLLTADRSFTLRVKNPSQAVLIVTPAGLALEQGDLRGELRWSELRGLEFKNQSILLKVAGAKLNILDVYHWPIRYLFLVLHHYTSRAAESSQK